MLVGTAFALVLANASLQPSESEEKKLEDIRAYVRVSDNLATSGQIRYDQIPAIKEAGFDVVVNLAPARQERNGEEGFLVTEQGMTYVQIPVDWENPSPRDLRLFFDVMNANRDRRVFVHCFANMRASAFVYLYRTVELGEPEETAKADMAKVWDPASEDQWARFVAEAKSRR